jgi:VIT1/CCC1 family predicted Fe2+/Mn2+ transporter
VLVVLLFPATNLSSSIAGVSLVALIGLGGLAAKVGGANLWIGAARVGFWGAAAMALTAAAGHLFGVVL